MNARLRLIIGAIGLLLVVFGIWFFRTITSYILIAAVVAFVGRPIVHLIERFRIKGRMLPRGLASTLTIIFLWAILIAFFRVFIPLVLNEANELSSINVNELYESLHPPLAELLHLLQKVGYFQEDGAFEKYITSKFMIFWGEDYLSTLFTSVTAGLGNLIIAFFAISFIAFFFIKDTSLFSSGVLLIVPDKYNDEVKHVLSTIRHLLSRYLGGIIIEVICVMVLITAGLYFVGVGFHHALVCGLFAGILNVIPYVGPWIGAIFGLLIGIATNLNLPFQSELLPLLAWISLVFVMVQIIDNILFQPLIYSSSVKAHPLEIFLIILMAANIAGIGGMVLAIPSYTVMRVIAKEFLSSFKVVKQLTRNI